MIFGLKNNFILLDSLKKKKHQGRYFINCIFKQCLNLPAKHKELTKTHVIVKTSCKSELGQSAVHLLNTNCGFQRFLRKHGNQDLRVWIVVLVSVRDWHLHWQETLADKTKEDCQNQVERVGNVHSEMIKGRTTF